MNRILSLIGVVLVVGCRPDEPDLSSWSDGELLAVASGVTKGAHDAPVAIVEFGDYQCPPCATVGLSIQPEIEETLMESGQVKWVFYDFPLPTLHPNAFQAARAARCASDQEKYWEYHDVLLGNQSSWANYIMPDSAFEIYAAEVGMDEGAFRFCLNSDAHELVVAAGMELGKRMGVSSVPHFFVTANSPPGNLHTHSLGFRNARPIIDAVERELTRVSDNPINATMPNLIISRIVDDRPASGERTFDDLAGAAQAFFINICLENGVSSNNRARLMACAEREWRAARE